MGVMVTDRRRGLRFAVAAAFVFLALLVVLLLFPKAAAGAVVSVKATPSAFSPNGDKVLDTVKLSVRLAASAKLFVGVYDERGRLVQTLQRPRSFGAGTRAYKWNGLFRGKARANGAYTVRAKATIRGRTKAARCLVTLDVLPPQVLLASGGRARVFAGADSVFGYEMEGSLPERLELQIYTATGANGEGGVEVAAVPVKAPELAGSVTWDGRDAQGACLATARYKVRFAATDRAGNSGVSRFEPISVYAPTAIAGSVRDAGGTPVAGATVGVAGTALSATTAADGSFAFAACPMGFRDLVASKGGFPDGRQRVKVNLETGAINLVLGKTPSPPRSNVASVTISGTMKYENDNDQFVPMRNVRVVLQDDSTVCWDDLQETSTDDLGWFSITYDPDEEWELWGYPDVRVIAFCEDGDQTIGEVCDGQQSLDPYGVVAGGTWEDNTASHTGLECNATGDDASIWYVLEGMQTAHDRWLQLTGYDAPPIWADYPVELGDVTAQFSFGPTYRCIDIDPDKFDAAGLPWCPTPVFHEYGHWLHYDSYTSENWGPDSNAYAAYNGLGGASFQKGGKTYSGKDKSFCLNSEGGEWGALTEGFADFFAAVCMDWDKGGYSNTLEHDVDLPNINDDKAAQATTRALWDVFDTPATKLCCWGVGSDWTQWTAIVRPVGPLGSGDDDRIGATENLAMLSRVWSVMDDQWPASISELRSAFRSRYASETRNLRLLDTVLRSKGLCAGEISNSPPDLGSVRTVADTKYGTANRGVIRVYCYVTDADTWGGMWDSDFVKVRLEYGRTSPYAPYDTDWYPIGFALEKASAPPPGQSGGFWYAIDWDTRSDSPIETIYTPKGFEWNNREYSVITGRKENVKLRLIATDDLQDCSPVAVPAFTVDNRPIIGVAGIVKHAATGAPIAGAEVKLHEGADAPLGPLVATVTTKADGAYEFVAVPAGDYTVVAAKSGYVTNWIGAMLRTGAITADTDVYLTPTAAGGIARATDVESFIRFPAGAGVLDTGGGLLTGATYEFWFKTTVANEIERSGTLAMTSMSYGNWPGGEAGTAPIMKILVDGRGTITFGLNENDGGGPMEGTWHFVRGRSEPQVGEWCHVAAQCGSGGMRLFVNGRLEASDPYAGSPEPDASAGTLGGGWFSVGDNDTFAAGSLTSRGYFKEVRVSAGARYTADFTPQNVATRDAATLLLDHLIGGTLGQYRKVVWQP